MHRTPAAALLLLACALLARPLEAGEGPPRLPKPLAENGFGAARTPLRVTFVGPIGEAADHPTLQATGREAPQGTQWLFLDPRPVYEVLARAKTRSYAPGRFPGAKARLRIDASEGDVRRVIHLHYRPGHGDISVRRAKGSSEGGGWTFDAAADRALVALLSRTRPHATGASPTRVWQLQREPATRGTQPQVGSILGAATFEAWRAGVALRYPKSSTWKLPPDFTWKTHFLVWAELPHAFRGRRLDYSGGTFRGGVLAWRLRIVAERTTGRAPDQGSVLLGAFPRMQGLTHVRADFDDGTQVAARTPDHAAWHEPRPDDVFLRIRERLYRKDADGGKGGWTTYSTIELHWNGRYTRRRDATVQHGDLPPTLVRRLEGAFQADVGKAGHVHTHDHAMEDQRTQKPDGLLDFLAEIARAHD